ncbi:MAG TPA: protein kinase, partial [Sinomonas sp.]|nr:protein kinase [Sinomonas sp.]
GAAAAGAQAAHAASPATAALPLASATDDGATAVEGDHPAGGRSPLYAPLDEEDIAPAPVQKQRRRRALTWPLVALVLLLIFVLLGILLSNLGLFSSPAKSPSSSPVSTPSQTPTVTATPTPTPTPTQTPTINTINVAAGDYVGRNYTTVQGELESLGFVVQLSPVTQQQTQAFQGEVLTLSPTGALPVGSTITVTYAVVPAPTPTATPTRSAPATPSTAPTSTPSATK